MAIPDLILGSREAQSSVVPSLAQPMGVETTVGPVATTRLNDSRRQFFAKDALMGAGQRSLQPDAFGFQIGTSQAASPPAKGLEFYPGILSEDFSARPSTEGTESMVRQLLAKGHVLAARKLVYAIRQDRGALERLRILRIVLGEPVVRRKGPAYRSHARNLEWLRRNGALYSGKWVALANGELLAADEALAPLRRTLRHRAPHVKPFLHRL